MTYVFYVATENSYVDVSYITSSADHWFNPPYHDKTKELPALSGHKLNSSFAICHDET